MVRWFGRSGRYGVLRADNANADAASILLDLRDPEALAEHQIRRVLRISSPR